jgi:hypothetical protein
LLLLLLPSLQPHELNPLDSFVVCVPSGFLDHVLRETSRIFLVEEKKKKKKKFCVVFVLWRRTLESSRVLFANEDGHG